MPPRPSGAPLLYVPGRSGSAARIVLRDGIVETLNFRGGTDRAEITVVLSNPQPGIGGQISIVKPTRQGIMTELSREFPGEAMVVVRTPMSNAYGPVGMAVNERCLYAWQWINSVAPRHDAEQRLFSTSGERPASVRVRLCRRGGETIGDLSRAVQHMRVRDPYGPSAGGDSPPQARRRAAARPMREPTPRPAAQPPAAVAPSAPAAPSMPSRGYAPVPMPNQAPVGQRPFITSPPQPATQAPPPPAETAPPVPRPAQGRYSGAPRVPMPSDPTSPAISAAPSIPAAPAPEPRRYLTDHPSSSMPATTGSAPIVPRPARAAPEASQPFSGDLPPEAYRGPRR